MRVFVAGAGGAVGRYLVPRLVERGHAVTATTKSAAKADTLRRMGAEVEILEGLDAAAVGQAVARAHPEAIVHEMTALAGASDLRRFDRAFATTNRLRTEGTANLLAAARATGVRRFVAQSYTGWNNTRTGGLVTTEDDPFDADPLHEQSETLAAIVAGGARGAARGRRPPVRLALRARGLRMRSSSSSAGGGCRSSATAAASGHGSTSRTRRRPRRPRSSTEPPASTTSSTTSRRRSRSGCPTSPASSAPSRRCASRPGSAGSPPVVSSFG